MLELNSEEIIKFKQEIDKLTSSMEKLKQYSVVNLKVSLPSDKTINRIENLNKSLASFNIKGFGDLTKNLNSLNFIKSVGLGNVIKDIDNLSSLNVSSAIGNLRDISAAYNKFNNDIKLNNKQENFSNNNNNNSFDTNLVSISKFIRVSNKSNPARIKEIIDSLKDIATIKVDDKTYAFMDNVSKIVSNNNRQNNQIKKQESSFFNVFNPIKQRQDITGVITTALTILGSGVFLKRQSNIAKEVVDLLASSEITGLDSFSNRSGIASLGVSPTSIANYQKQMSRDLIGAQTFGEIDPKKLILMSQLGIGFNSTLTEILYKGLNFSAKQADFIYSRLGGEDLALAGSRLRNARKGASSEQIKSIDSILLDRDPNIDVGVYSRFDLFFRGFFAKSKVFFQEILQPSLDKLGEAFRVATGKIQSLNQNKKAISAVSTIISSFISSIITVFEKLSIGFIKLGTFIVNNNLVEPLSQVASVLGYIVAGGLILKVFGLITAFFTSLLGLKKIVSLGSSLLGLRSGIALTGTTSRYFDNTISGGILNSGAKTFTSSLFRGASGILTVKLAEESVRSIGNFLNIKSEAYDTKTDFYKDKFSKGLKLIGAGSATIGAYAAATGAGLPTAVAAGSISAAAYGSSYVIDHGDKILDMLANIYNSLTEQQNNTGQPINLTLIQDKNGNIRDPIKGLKTHTRN